MLFVPTGGFGNGLPYYGDEWRSEVRDWCQRTFGYVPRLSHEDHFVRDENGNWPEYDSAWFCYFETESDLVTFKLAFDDAVTLARFRDEDGVDDAIQ